MTDKKIAKLERKLEYLKHKKVYFKAVLDGITYEIERKERVKPIRRWSELKLRYKIVESQWISACKEITRLEYEIERGKLEWQMIKECNNE